MLIFRPLYIVTGNHSCMVVLVIVGLPQQSCRTYEMGKKSLQKYKHIVRETHLKWHPLAYISL